MLLVFLGFALFSWWAQRDAYRTGIEAGRQLERLSVLERELALDMARRGEHVREVT